MIYRLRNEWLEDSDIAKCILVNKNDLQNSIAMFLEHLTLPRKNFARRNTSSRPTMKKNRKKWYVSKFYLISLNSKGNSE